MVVPILETSLAKMPYGSLVAKSGHEMYAADSVLGATGDGRYDLLPPGPRDVSMKSII